MKTLKFLILLVVLAVAVAEPPRRRANNFRAFARQEGAPENENPPPSAEGYKYQQPQGEQLRLPTKFTARFKLGRQQEETTQSSNGGYSYPKPTESYGPPLDQDSTNQPDTDYGLPDDTTTVAPDDDDATDNPQSERLKGFNRKNAKLTRLQVSQKIRTQPVKSQPVKSQLQFQQQQQQPQQPIFYVVNNVPVPVAEYVQPQLEYYYVLNK